MGSTHWWPVAQAAEIGVGKPQGYFIDDEPVVLFRDGQGAIRALEDRCPHRRVPLSLGTVRPDGLLQCGYHGWSFDGATGKCMVIPTLRDGEKVPSVYGAYAYQVKERYGLVYVAAGRDVQALPDAPYEMTGRVFSGRRMVSLAHDDYIAALMDGPHLLLDTPAFRIVDTMIADPHMEGDYLVMERAAFWKGQTRFDAFVREYKLIFRLMLDPATGEAWIALLLPDGSRVAVAHLAVTPSSRGVTAILWQSSVPDGKGVRHALLRMLAGMGRPPVAPREHIDGNGLAYLLVGPSDQWPRRSERALYGEVLTRERARA